MAERIEKLLDALDERLVKGEISEETYKELKAKYSAKLEKITGEPPVRGVQRKSAEEGKSSIEEIERFLYSLERRFVHGEISEAAYLKLRKEYEQKLAKAYEGSRVIEGANRDDNADKLDKDKDHVTGLFGEKYKKYNKMTKEEKKGDAIRNIVIIAIFLIVMYLLSKSI